MKWVCKVCGYETEGDSPPEECPICGVDKTNFESVDGEMTDLPDQSKEAIRKMTYGIYIVTTSLDGKLNGQTANSVTQITSKPRQVVMGLNKENLTTEMVLKSRVLAVNVMGIDEYNTVALFGFSSGRTKDKFKEISYKVDKDLPLLKEHAVAGFTCKVINQMDAGSHILFLCEVDEGGFVNEAKKDILPMSYSDFRTLKSGKSLEPKGVVTPDAVPEEGKYICDVCGWVYDPSVEGKPFAKQPEDFVCPICGATKSQFSSIS